MSEHRSHHVAAAFAVLAFAAVAAPEASAVPVDPDRGSQSSPLVPYDWPDEGSGYPGYGDQPAPTVSTQGSALDATSVALGALGGIAFGAAALGITLAVQRRRDHTPLSEV
ncbi:hypothetical protein EV646_101526 [Kribbella antiqua]|uniref:Cobalt/nickel transport protein n=1 Tax=Kribbella antiqua TaxID=2512217 RepID=A0A4R2J9G4_9ACTN|nr:hypothetical protein [Kribbella antiqua]TCO51535.1 hypothetical protein EV646_101526 [Kribbella antiqua]